MNVERLEQVAKVLDGGELPGRRRFDMSHWDCGTACCIGGLADVLFNGGAFRHWPDTAQDLDLSPTQADELFFPEGLAAACTDPKLGAQAIRNLIADPDGDPWRHVNRTSSDV